MFLFIERSIDWRKEHLECTLKRLPKASKPEKVSTTEGCKKNLQLFKWRTLHTSEVYLLIIKTCKFGYTYLYSLKTKQYFIGRFCISTVGTLVLWQTKHKYTFNTVQTSFATQLLQDCKLLYLKLSFDFTFQVGNNA